jgi:hypothetical protein
MAEWFKAAVLKTVRRKPRGFESLSLRHRSPSVAGLHSLTRRALPVVLVVIVFGACGHAGPVRFGTFTGALAPSSIPDLVASPELHLGRQIAVRGTVVQVCQEMGCWFEVMEGGKRLMVDLQMGRRFTIPKGSTGFAARVEGKLIRDEGVLKMIGEGVELSPPGAS